MAGPPTKIMIIRHEEKPPKIAWQERAVGRAFLWTENPATDSP
jgi:hypothetical protein